MRHTRISLFAFLSLFAAFALCTGFAHAQSSSAPSRITGAVDENVLTPLQGNITARAQQQFDQGAASPSTQLTHMRLVLKRSPTQDAALKAFAAQQLDPNSPNYHNWITPEQFGQRYGLSEADISALTNWIQFHGLTVESVSKGRNLIYFSGTVGQVEEMLHTQIHSFKANGEQFYANISAPQIPAAFAPVVIGVAHLNTLVPRPNFKAGPVGLRNPQTKKLEPMPKQTGGVSPNLTLSSNGQPTLYITPMDAATIYDTPNTTYNINYAAGTTYDGTGVTIGIGGTSSISLTTLGNFHSGYMNSAATNTTEVDTGAVSVTTGQDEAYLDLELSSGMAPGASIIYYPSADLFSGITTAIDANNIDIFSLSYGQCEWFMDSADNASMNATWLQAAVQGISVTASSGDSGTAGCDNPNGPNGTNTINAQYGAQVSGLASTPYDIAVGGTDFYDLLNNFNTYVSSNNNPTYSGSAKGYIPESSWNESTASSTFNLGPGWGTPADSYLANNYPWDVIPGDSQYDAIWAGSGGPSICSTNDTTYGVGGAVNTGNCISGYPKPAWQTGSGVPADGARDLPDVSLMSGSGLFNAAWLACTDDPVTGQPGITTNCDATNPNTNYFASFGGTSAATPSFAGILAQVRQKTGGRLGQAAAQLYALAASANGSTIFHDTQLGNNSVACDPTLTPDGSCQIDSIGYNFESGYNTATGYDLATGLGSVDATQLVANWPATTGLGAFTVTASDVTITAGATTGNTSNITITPTGNYSGTVTWTATVTSAPAGAVGVPTFTYTPATGLTFTNGGAAQSGTVAVNTTGTVAMLHKSSPYEYASNRGNWFKAAGGFVFASFLLFFVPGRIRRARNLLMTLLLTVACTFTIIGCGNGNNGPNFLTPTITVTPGANPVSYNSALSVSVAVTGSGAAPTGTVTLTSGSYTSATTTLAAGSATFSIPANTFKSAGTYNLIGNYSGDMVYNSGTGSSSVKVTGPATTTGNYVVTVVATGSDAAATTRSTTFNLTVN